MPIPAVRGALTANGPQRHRRKPTGFKPTVRAFIVALFASTAASLPALAQSVATLPAPPVTLPFLPPVSGDWTVTIGAGGEMKPDYEGARQAMFSPVPIFYVRRAGSADTFHGSLDDPSVAVIDYGGFRAGPVGNIVAARTVSGHPELNGLGDVNTTYQIGGFFEYFPVDWFRTRVEVLQGFGGQHGVVANFSSDFIVPLSQHWTVSGGPRFTAWDNNATSSYFGISQAQALASGLPTFNARGGIHSAGAGAQLRYQYNPQWEVHSFVEYERLLGDAADSPLVAQRGSPNQVTVGIGASYSFDVTVR